VVWWIGASNKIAAAVRQIGENSDRGVAIIAAAILEERLNDAIKRRWVDSPTAVQRMLQVDGGGPLGSFGPKIDLVYLMGLISADGHKDMKIIKKIRNKFAHYIDVDTFETPTIKNWCFDLKHFQNFVMTDAELQGAPIPKKLFGVVGMDANLQIAKERYIVAAQVYSALFGGDQSPYLPPVDIPTPLY
jgi:DNA-binding MltR family transcriptional regulator